MTRLTPKLALAGVAAVGLYLPSMGLPLPLNSCQPTLGVANAAPSPSCGGDLRECLRQSADMRQTTFGGRYVTAEDVARCMEAFNACIHGGASRGGNPVPPASTSSGSSSKTGLPSRFRVSVEGITGDCQISGNTVSCSESWEARPEYVISWSGTLTGEISGMTMTGTWKSHNQTHSTGDDTSCIADEDYSGPVTYDFSPDGTVKLRSGPLKRTTSFSGSCTGSNSGETPLGEVVGTWSPSE